MRRLALVLAALALLALGMAAGAVGAKPRSRLTVTKGTARQVGDRVRGRVVVANLGRAASTPARHLEIGVRWRQREPNGATVRMAPNLHLTLLPRLAPGKRQTIRFDDAIPASVPPGRRALLACLYTCRRIGWITVDRSGGGPSPGEPKPGQPGSPGNQPISTVPTDPLLYIAGEPFEVTSGSVPYWAFVPSSYHRDNLTPAPLLVWLHGCGGESSGDIWVVDPGAEDEPQDWVTIAVGGREGECWTPRVDEAKVMAALADVETHFNIDRGRVALGGYSSGGDLAYRTGFRHSETFAGLLIENSSPFRDTESSAAESLAAATRKLPIVHLAHTGDTTYPIDGVRQEVGEVAAAGFPIELIERPGAHYDGGTDGDLVELLLPRIDGDWPA
jgi:dienelactone hydrolase